MNLAFQLRKWRLSHMNQLFGPEEIVSLRDDVLTALGLEKAVLRWTDNRCRQYYIDHQLKDDDQIKTVVITRVLDELAFDELVQEGRWFCLALLQRDQEFILVMYLPRGGLLDSFVWSAISQEQFDQLYQEANLA